MAANTTVKVATLTGAAKDDVLTGAMTGLSEDHLSSSLNVLANDPGAAKLYSLAQNAGALTSTTQFPVVTSVTLASGATISINPDGTIAYDASTLSSSLQSLGAGEAFTDTFVYTVRMANGALSTAKVMVTLDGVNDAPTLAGITPVSILDTAADDTPAAVTGTLVGADVDHGAVLSYAFADGTLSSTNAYGTMTIDAQTGAYSFTADQDKIDSLALGEDQDLSFDVKVTDEHGASASTEVKFKLVGANDGPTLAAVAAATIADTAADDTPAAVTGTLVGADVDHGAVLSYAFADGSLTSTNEYGTMTIDAQTGAYSFTADSDKIDSLAAGVNASTSFDVKVTDEHGASAATSVAFDFTGANDTAEISGTNSGAVAEDGTLVATGTVNVSDRDAGELGFQAPASLAGAYGDFTFDAATGAWTYTLRNGDANVQALATGTTVSDSLTVQSFDGSASETIQVSIAGLDEPVVPTPPTPSSNTPTPNPIVTFTVNHGQTFENGKWLISSFDANDVLAYAGSYKDPVITLTDFNNDGTMDTVLHFDFKKAGGGGGGDGVVDNPVDVILLGFSTLAASQVVHA